MHLCHTDQILARRELLPNQQTDNDAKKIKLDLGKFLLQEKSNSAVCNLTSHVTKPNKVKTKVIVDVSCNLITL